MQAMLTYMQLQSLYSKIHLLDFEYLKNEEKIFHDHKSKIKYISLKKEYVNSSFPEFEKISKISLKCKIESVSEIENIADTISRKVDQNKSAT
jgi:hypothetical protein